jgi:molecular chaperone GrpE (heat shock protein)
MNTFIQSINFLQAIVVFSITSIFFVLLGLVLKNIRPKENRSSDKFDELYKKISEDIKYAIAPKFIEMSLGVNDLVDLAVEVWRIEQRVAKSVSSLPEQQLKGLDNSIQKLKRYLSKYDIEILDYKNQKYNDGLNLDILSVEKDNSLSEPIIKETIEPTIMCKGQVVRKAKIILLTNKQ